MGLSVKKIFQKKDSNESVEKKKSSDVPNNSSNTEKEIKHETPTGCCGGCS